MSHAAEPSTIPEDDLAPTTTQGYKVSLSAVFIPDLKQRQLTVIAYHHVPFQISQVGSKKTVEEYAQLDAEDESLAKWKASLGIGAGGAGGEKNVAMLSLSLVSDSRAAGPLVFDLTVKDQLAALKKNPVNIKEGSEYAVELKFTVSGDVVSGLRYIQVVRRAGINVDKMDAMLGSYGPSNEPIVKRFVSEEAPSSIAKEHEEAEQSLAGAYSLDAFPSPSSAAKVAHYSRISSLYREAIYEQLAEIESNSDIPPPRKEILLVHFASLHSILALNEILYLPTSPADGVVGEELLDWLNTVDSAPSSEEGAELALLGSPWESDNFWPFLSRCVLRAHLRGASTLVTRLSTTHPSPTIRNLSEIPLRLIDTMPRSTTFKTEREFLSKFRDWRQAAREAQETFDGLTETNGHDEDEEGLKGLMGILVGDEKIVLDLSEDWREAVAAWGVWVKPELRRDDLADVVRQVTRTLPEDATMTEEAILASLLKGDVARALQQSNTHSLWLVSHLSDLLDKVGAIPSAGSSTLPSRSNPFDQTPAAPELSLRDHFTLSYTDILLSDPGQWRIVLDYLSSCGSEGRARMRGVILSVRLDEESKPREEGEDATMNGEGIKENDPPDRRTERVEEVLRVCVDHGLDEEMKKICKLFKTYAELLIAKKEYGPAVAFCMRAEDSKRVARIAERVLNEYVVNGQEAFIRYVDSMPTAPIRPSAPEIFDEDDDAEEHGIHHQPFSSRLSFLARYRDFFALYATGSRQEAATLLVLLLTSGVAPKGFYAGLELKEQNLPSLEGVLQVITHSVDLATVGRACSTILCDICGPRSLKALRLPSFRPKRNSNVSVRETCVYALKQATNVRRQGSCFSRLTSPPLVPVPPTRHALQLIMTAGTAEGPSLLLIGMRGAGKTTLGALVASHLNLPFVDADALFCSSNPGHTPPTFVKQYGWPAFRAAETAILANILADIADGERKVVSLGGGVVEEEQNRQMLKKFWGGSVDSPQVGRDRGIVIHIFREIDQVFAEPGKVGGRQAPQWKMGGQEEIWARRRPWFRECSSHEFVNFTNASPIETDVEDEIDTARQHRMHFEQVERDFIRFFRRILGPYEQNSEKRADSPFLSRSSSLRSYLVTLPFTDLTPHVPSLHLLCTGASAIELRADLLSDPHPHPRPGVAEAYENPSLSYISEQHALLRRHAPDIPIVFTLRTPAQGGRYPYPSGASEESLFSTLHHALKLGTDLIDIEQGLDPVRTARVVADAKERKTTVIIAWRDVVGPSSGGFSWSGPEARKRYEAAIELGADIVKIVGTASDVQDNFLLRVFAFSDLVKNGPPLSAYNMGPFGRMSRFLNPLLASVTHPVARQSTRRGVVGAPSMTFKEVQMALHLSGLLSRQHFVPFTRETDSSELGILRRLCDGGFEELGLPYELQRSAWKQSDRNSIVSIEEALRFSCDESFFAGGCVSGEDGGDAFACMNETTDLATGVGGVDTFVLIPGAGPDSPSTFRGDHVYTRALIHVLGDRLSPSNAVSPTSFAVVLSTTAPEEPLPLAAGTTSEIATASPQHDRLRLNSVMLSLGTLGIRRVAVFDPSTAAVSLEELSAKQPTIVVSLQHCQSIPAPLLESFLSSSTGGERPRNLEALRLQKLNFSLFPGIVLNLDPEHTGPDRNSLVELAQTRRNTRKGWIAIDAEIVDEQAAREAFKFWTGRTCPPL
ncbi:nuclear pore complex protein Nup85, partial [Phenoliferia sp. Uapishka_3]